MVASASKTPSRWRPYLTIGLWLVAIGARANMNMASYLIDPPTPSGSADATEMPTARFSIYLDPLKLRWICWSRLDATTFDNQGRAMVDAPAAMWGRMCMMRLMRIGGEGVSGP